MFSIVIRLLIIALLVYAGVHLWYGMVEKRLQEQVPATSDMTEPPPAAVDVAPTPADQPADDLRIILERNIFSASLETTGPSEPSETDSELENLAETQLSLSLLGTVTGTPDDARAIIRDEKTKLEDIYRVGSEIQGALINRITRGKVVLVANGREEVLILKEPEGPGTTASPGRRTPAGGSAQFNGADEAQQIQPVPEAVPRRRISFRSPGPRPPVAAPVESAVPVESAEPEWGQAEGQAEETLPSEESGITSEYEDGGERSGSPDN